MSLEGVVDDYGKPVKDKKTGEPKAAPDPEWLLFEKCMRGDTSDNVFSAYPGVRKKGTKNKVGLIEAFEDRNSKGFNWNNMMLQRWTDHNGEEHRVLDDYERNRTLVDLTAQPAELKEYIDTTMREQMEPKANKMVGAKFLKFCGKYELNRIAEDATKYAAEDADVTLRLFNVLKDHKKGKSGEVHITYAIKKMIFNGSKYVGHKFSGKYLDCGTMSGYINSSLEITKL